MKFHTGNRKIFSLSALLLMGMVYASIALHSKPAYAAACEAYCEDLRDAVEFECEFLHFSQLIYFECPLPWNAEQFAYWCAGAPVPTVGTCN